MRIVRPFTKGSKKHESRVSNQLIRGLMDLVMPLLAHPQDRRSVQQHAQHIAVME